MEKIETERNVYLWIGGYLYIKNGNGDTIFNCTDGVWSSLGDCKEDEISDAVSFFEAEGI